VTLEIQPLAMRLLPPVRTNQQIFLRQMARIFLLFLLFLKVRLIPIRQAGRWKLFNGSLIMTLTSVMYNGIAERLIQLLQLFSRPVRLLELQITGGFAIKIMLLNGVNGQIIQCSLLMWFLSQIRLTFSMILSMLPAVEM